MAWIAIEKKLEIQWNLLLCRIHMYCTFNKILLILQDDRENSENIIFLTFKQQIFVCEEMSEIPKRICNKACCQLNEPKNESLQ